MRGARTLRVLTLVAVAATAACGDDSDAPDAGTHVLAVAPGSFVEADFTMAEGAAVTAAFDSADISLSWNVHTHRGDQEERYLEGTSPGEPVSFAASAAGRYSFYWENLASFEATLQVDFTLAGDVTFEGWYQP